MASHYTLHIIVWLLNIINLVTSTLNCEQWHRCNLSRMISVRCGAAADNICHSNLMPAKVTPCLWYSAASSRFSSVKVKIIPLTRLSFFFTSWKYFSQKIFLSVTTNHWWDNYPAAARNLLIYRSRAKVVKWKLVPAVFWEYLDLGKLEARLESFKLLF